MMIEDRQMGSQTLEILRQGVWASLTGGWFYDPHQDEFCNTFHLYLWLFLLCLPFTIYVYFPPDECVWYAYCSMVAVAFAAIKLVNYGLHHMYDTTECIKEEIVEEWPEQKKEEEGIELQVLSNKPSTSTAEPVFGGISHTIFGEAAALPSTDADSIDSGDYEEIGAEKPSSTIDLRAEVHRKNSSESSEEITVQPNVKIVAYHPKVPEKKRKLAERRSKHRQKTDDGPSTVATATIREDASKQSKAKLAKHHQDHVDGEVLQEVPSLQSVESEGLAQAPRRHSNFTNSSLGFIHSSVQTEIKATGSLELGYIDKNPNQALTGEGFFFKQHTRGGGNCGVRRIRSTALEICCQPPPLTVHPNSLEVIGGGGGAKGTKNPLPPPSSTLVRNQHLNLCPYYGSEIVYPIAEQSDEHQTSHGPDTDLESLHRNSDSDYEENNQGSRSPLLFRLDHMNLMKMPVVVPYAEKDFVRMRRNHYNKNDEERTSATSKDALLDRDHSTNSSVTPEMQDARAECCVGGATDNETGGAAKKFCSCCANLSCSNTSVECEEERQKRGGGGLRVRGCCCDDELVGVVVQRGGGELKGCVKRGDHRRNRKRRSSGSMKSVDGNNCSSLVELDLDWLFDDENERLKHSKENRKRDMEWSSTTTVSLEHDVSKVLQETVPSARSLGAIPKKLRPQISVQELHTTKTPRAVVKSESERCCRRRTDRRQQDDHRHFTRNRSMKENKLTQTLRQNDSSVEGLECLVLPNTSQTRLRRLSAPRRSGGGKGGARGRNEAPYQQEASSSGSNNELSTLLPTQPLLQAFLASRRDFGMTLPNTGNSDSPPQRYPRLRRSCRPKREPQPQQQQCCRSNRPPSIRRAQRDLAIAHTLSTGHGTHTAKNFNDTSDGSVHCFVDEHGNWVTYTFDERGCGTANARPPEHLPNTAEKSMSEVIRKGDVARSYRNTGNKVVNDILWDSNSTESICNSSLSIILDVGAAPKAENTVPPTTTATTMTNTMIPTQRTVNLQTVPVTELHARLRAVRHRIMTQYGYDPAIQNLIREDIMSEGGEVPRNRFRFVSPADTTNHNCARTKSYYKVKVLPWTHIKVTLDRLKLLALLDRNLTFSETALSIFLGVLVSVLGAILLIYGFYNDLLAFIFCFVIASCQYSLLKSVQPDAASPTHGFNRLIAYSRPVYFCLCSLLVILLHLQIDPNSSFPLLTIGGATYTNTEIQIFVRDFILKFILFFPLLFSLGLFPQINTFILYLLEQIDMYVFGGNAMSSLLSAFCCIFRSLLAVICMSGLAYGGLSEPKSSQHILFSMFCACLVSCCYHLSRNASDPVQLWNILKRHFWPPDIYKKPLIAKETPTEKPPETHATKVSTEDKEQKKKSDELVDPLPEKLQKTVNARLKNDVIMCAVVAILAFVIHASTVFTALQHDLGPVLWCIAASLGFLLHYVIPQFRKQLPWLCIARPVFRSQEYDLHQIHGPAKIMWYEKVYVYLCFLERNILYPLVFLSALTEDSPTIAQKFGPLAGSFMVVICGLKCLRSCYSDQSSQYLILTFTALFHKYDYNFIQQTFLIEYFIISIIYYKTYELLLKVQFVVTYIAPWQITWGSAFHAFAQPFSVPHSAMLFLQALISAVLSTPLNPFLGSAIFLTSYVRPVKFWERDYNTRRVDHSNTPLSSHLDRNLGADDNNLNSIFYEHLTRSLQHSLCGDLIMGRWGPVNQGDCFVLASDYLNCLVHIIEMGNGLVTFQMRGLEFRGTYCQQREVEAITEGVEENDGCCCCDPGHLPSMLSVNAAFSQRWLAWEVTASKYIIEGYSISDNNAVSMLQVFDFRKVLVTYYVKSIIFYATRSSKLEEWLLSQNIQKALKPMQNPHFVDLDPVFNYNIDEDYDNTACGMTKNMFCQTYGDWITYCVKRSGRNIDSGNNSAVVLLCFALSLLGRRTLGAVSHNTISSVEFFLYGLHALFKGDFRITCARDEWVFTDMDLLKTVVAPGVRMSLKLHQDHFMVPDEYQEFPTLYDAICKHEEELVISHEGDPAWRNAVLSGTSSLLALRHVLDDGADEYKIIMLNKRYLSFRVIKVNKECVRGLWAGQQQELVYLRNRNPERGSIQNAKQALRNIINSSCDQPIGYPIYVSPLTTSYADTNEQLCSLIGGSISISKIRDSVLQLFRRVRKRCGEGCSSGASTREEMGLGNEGIYAMTPVTTLGHHTAGSQSTEGSHLGGSIGRGSSLSRTSLGGNRGSLASMGKPTSSTLASLAGLFKERDERAISQVPDVPAKGDERTGEIPDHLDKDVTLQRVRIIDPNLVYDCINLGRRIDVLWPNEYMRARGGRSHWRDWLPETGMEGQVVHRWIPCHKDPSKRSHVDRTILLVQIDDKYVPIAESGVQDLGAEV